MAKILMAMKLFRDKKVSISKNNNIVTVACENENEAEVIFEWLSNINGKYTCPEDFLYESYGHFSQKIEYIPPEAVHFVKAAFWAGSNYNMDGDIE